MPRAEITIDLERAQRAIDDAQRDLDAYAPDLDLKEFRTLITEAQRLLLAVDGLLSERAQATERARIAAAAYDGQQSSQRELEALYQAATERAERMERVAMSLLPLCEGLHEALEAGDTWNARARSNARDSLAKAIVAAKVGML